VHIFLCGVHNFLCKKGGKNDVPSGRLLKNKFLFLYVEWFILGALSPFIHNSSLAPILIVSFSNAI